MVFSFADVLDCACPSELDPPRSILSREPLDLGSLQDSPVQVVLDSQLYALWPDHESVLITILVFRGFFSQRGKCPSS